MTHARVQPIPPAALLVMAAAISVCPGPAGAVAVTPTETTVNLTSGRSQDDLLAAFNRAARELSSRQTPRQSETADHGPQVTIPRSIRLAVIPTTRRQDRPLVHEWSAHLLDLPPPITSR